MKKLIFLIVICFAIFSHVYLSGYFSAHLTAHAQGVEEAGQESVVLGSNREFVELNPFKPYSSGDVNNILDLVFSTLLKIDRRGNASAGAAEGWFPSPDMKQWTFRLRRDVLFHDGTQLKADDVVFTFGVLLNGFVQNENTIFFKNINRIEQLDDFTVVFHLNKPDQVFLFLISTVLIVPSGYFNADGTPKDVGYYFHHPIGSGPFKVKSFSKDLVELERNEGYFLGRPPLKGVVYKNLKSERGVFSALIHQEVDVMSVPTSNYAYSKLVRNIPYLGAGSHFSAALFLFFNQADPVLRDSNVRQALNYLVDKQKMLTEVLKLDRSVIASSLVPPGSGFVNSDLEPYPYNPAYALELLKKSGWVMSESTGLLMKDGEPLSFEVVAINDVQHIEKALEFLSLELRHAGIEMKVKLMGLNELVKNFEEKTGRYSFFYYYSNSAGIYADWMVWKNNFLGTVKENQQSKVNDLLDQARFTDSADESLKLYREFQKVAHDDPPVLYLFWQDFPIFYNTRLSGLESDQWLTYREFHKVRINQ